MLKSLLSIFSIYNCHFAARIWYAIINWLGIEFVIPQYVCQPLYSIFLCRVWVFGETMFLFSMVCCDLDYLD